MTYYLNDFLKYNINKKSSFLKFDGFTKSALCPLIVIPAKPVLDLIGEQESSQFKPLWIPAFAGMTRFLTFCDSIQFASNRPLRALFHEFTRHQTQACRHPEC